MSEQTENQQRFLEKYAASATVTGDVIEVASGAWVIHGSIPVDGEVILAEYESQDDANRALEALTCFEDPSCDIDLYRH